MDLNRPGCIEGASEVEKRLGTSKCAHVVVFETKTGHNCEKCRCAMPAIVYRCGARSFVLEGPRHKTNFSKPAAAQPREKASTKPPNYVPHHQVQYHVRRSTSRLASFEVTTGGYAFITGKPLGKPAGPRGCAPSEMKNGPSLVPAHEIVRVVGSATALSPQIACNLEAQAQIAQTESLCFGGLPYGSGKSRAFENRIFVLVIWGQNMIAESTKTRNSSAIFHELEIMEPTVISSIRMFAAGNTSLAASACYFPSVPDSLCCQYALFLPRSKIRVNQIVECYARTRTNRKNVWLTDRTKPGCMCPKAKRV
ncbi:hypothetical protein H4582DRAFT_2128209 [Lactarius indigo]|nr:hypothetical protein H4582DRAFT_2128209 [Lactarius indigo]